MLEDAEKILRRIFPAWTERHSEHLEHVKIRNEGEYWIFNYRQFAPEFIKKDKYFRMMRGLIVRSDGIMVAYPFYRFYNMEEPYADPIDWNNAYIMEKIDGTMTTVWWDGEWHVSTRNKITADEPYNSTLRKFVDLNKLDKLSTYVFETVSTKAPIVTWYPKDSVYLLMVRDMVTLEEWSFEETEEEARRLGVQFPRYWRLMEEIPPLPVDHEGFVVRDERNNRIKVKLQSYHLIRKGEIFELLDADHPVINFVRNKYNELLRDAYRQYLAHYHLSRKEFALKIKDNLLSFRMFELYPRDVLFEEFKDFDPPKSIKKLLKEWYKIGRMELVRGNGT